MYYNEYEGEQFPPTYDFTDDEQEKAQKVIDLMEDWFWSIENGTSNNRFPDDGGERYTEDFVNKFIDYMDAFFQNELDLHETHWMREGQATKGKDITENPNFNRLTGISREAFVQSIRQKFMEVYHG